MAAVANKDPAIKLFGRTISLPDSQFSDDSESLDNGSGLMVKPKTGERRRKNSSTLDEVVSFEGCNGEQAQTPMKQPSTSQATIKPKVQQEESDGGGEQKLMKRPDKILPCPRCNSLDTKFCYFNNYNVNQPRHFCKNCQRYWTAGGTVRNVPIGAGRRRNKHLASQYRQVIANSDVGSTMMAEGTDSANQLLSCEESSSSCTTSSPNEMVLKFGPESPHFDNSTPNLLSNRESNGCSEVDLSNTSGSSPHQFYRYVVPPQITPPGPHLNGSVPLGVAGFASPNIPYQIVPAGYMNCIPVWVAGSGNISLAVPNGCVSGSQLQLLGKHSRDINAANEGRTPECISAPKILRIHELDQA